MGSVFDGSKRIISRQNIGERSGKVFKLTNTFSRVDNSLANLYECSGLATAANVSNAALLACAARRTQRRTTFALQQVATRNYSI